MNICKVTGKRMFATIVEAERYVSNWRVGISEKFHKKKGADAHKDLKKELDEVPKYYHPCKHCKHFHITRKPNNGHKLRTKRRRRIKRRRKGRGDFHGKAHKTSLSDFYNAQEE